MKKINIPNKKVMISLILVAAIIIGAFPITGLILRETTVIDVAPVAWYAADWTGSTIVEGLVTTDVSQPVYLNEGDVVEKVLVKEGQTVKPGTPLISYDTVLLEYQIEIYDLELKLIDSYIRRSEKALTEYKEKYKDALAQVLPKKQETEDDPDATASTHDNPVTETPTPSPSPSTVPSDEPKASTHEEPTTEAPETSVQTEEKVVPFEDIYGGVSQGAGSFTPTGNKKPLSRLTTDSMPYAGEGTKDEPYRFFLRSGARISGNFIIAQVRAEKTKTLYIAVETRENNAFDGKVMSTILLMFTPEATFDMDFILDESLAPNEVEESPEPPTPSTSLSPTETPGGEETPIPSGEVTPDPSEEVSPTPTTDVTPSPTPEVTPSPTPTPTPTPTPSPTPTPTPKVTTKPTPTRAPTPKPNNNTNTNKNKQTAAPTPTPTPSPTPSEEILEIKMQYTKMQQELSDLKLDKQQLALDLKVAENKLKKGSVESQVQGVVTQIRDTKDVIGKVAGAADLDTPLLVVAGEGYYAKGVFTEIDALVAEIGQEVKVQSWRTGLDFTGSLVDIGQYPVIQEAYQTQEVSRLTQYPFTVYIQPEHTLSQGEFVELTLQYMDGMMEEEDSAAAMSKDPEEDNTANTVTSPEAMAKPKETKALPDDFPIYLERAYVREDETGLEYVYVANAAQRLVKKYVNTGKIFLGKYVEIRKGLTREDLIAFPYAKGIREGVRIKELTPAEFDHTFGESPWPEGSPAPEEENDDVPNPTGKVGEDTTVPKQDNTGGKTNV